MCLIGRDGTVNRRDSAREKKGAARDGVKADMAKVQVGRADEVGERGAFRMVNRILFAAAAGG
jgi:hypothetical protein